MFCIVFSGVVPLSNYQGLSTNDVQPEKQLGKKRWNGRKNASRVWTISIKIEKKKILKGGTIKTNVSF